jgi:catechol 2,3-dioxygenase-like lactoylglutathione lyase family enzyme
MVRSELERQPGGRVVGRDDHEVVACIGDRLAKDRGVEPRERSRVRTVEDDVVDASAHAPNALSRRPSFAAGAHHAVVRIRGCLGPARSLLSSRRPIWPRARDFYEHTLGLRFLEQSDFACVFDANAHDVRTSGVTAVSKVADPGYTVLGWRVADIGAAVHALTLNGLTFTQYDGMGQDLDGIWTTRAGDKVAWFTDPDGNNVSLTQLV